MKPHRAMKRAADRRPQHAFTRFGLLSALQSRLVDLRAEDAERVAKGEPALNQAKIAELAARLDSEGSKPADPSTMFDAIL